MPPITRSSVVLPAPLWPISPTRSPWLKRRLTPSSATTSGVRDEDTPMRPPVVACTTRDFSERPPASKIGKMTETSSTLIETIGSDPIGDSPTVAGKEREGNGEAGNRDPQ